MPRVRFASKRPDLTQATETQRAHLCDPQKSPPSPTHHPPARRVRRPKKWFDFFVGRACRSHTGERVHNRLGPPPRTHLLASHAPQTRGNAVAGAHEILGMGERMNTRELICGFGANAKSRCRQVSPRAYAYITKLLASGAPRPASHHAPLRFGPSKFRR
jgi:hypothetical protein